MNALHELELPDDSRRLAQRSPKRRSQIGVSSTALAVYCFASVAAAQAIEQVSLPVARAGALSVKVDNLHLFLGGYTAPQPLIPPTPSLVVDIFNEQTGFWDVWILEVPCSGLTGAAFGGRAYIVDGCDNSLVKAFDPVAKSWTDTGKSILHAGAAVESTDTHIIFAGGSCSASPCSPFGAQPSAAVDIFEPISGSWTNASLSLARSGIGSAAIGQTALFAGGSTGTIPSIPPMPITPTDVVDIYDSAIDSWSTTQLSAPRANIATAVVGDRAFFVGGTDSDGPSDAVDVYDATTGTWTATLLPGTFPIIAVEPFGDGLLAVSSGAFHIYRPEIDQWETIQSNSLAPNGGFAISTFDYTSIVVGGVSLFGYTHYQGFTANFDCDGDGHLDFAQIDSQPSLDCNTNGQLDSCDIASGLSADLDSNGVPDECVSPPLDADLLSLSVADGGEQVLALAAGPQPIINFYLILGSLSGTSPGLVLEQQLLPLNLDDYFLYTLQFPNSAVHVSTFGVLPASGSATASIVLPPGLNPILAGLTMHHAYLVIDGTTDPANPYISFTSNAVPLALLP